MVAEIVPHCYFSQCSPSQRMGSKPLSEIKSYKTLGLPQKYTYTRCSPLLKTVWEDSYGEVIPALGRPKLWTAVTTSVTTNVIIRDSLWGLRDSGTRGISYIFLLPNDFSAKAFNVLCNYTCGSLETNPCAAECVQWMCTKILRLDSNNCKNL